MGLREIASRLIEQYGQPATLLRGGSGATNGFGEASFVVATSYPVTIVSERDAIEVQLAQSTYFEVGDKRVFLSINGLLVEPLTTDRFTIGGQIYATRRVSSLVISGEVIFWELQLYHV